MNDYQKALKDFADLLALEAPERVVTRNFMHWSQRPVEELEQGVLSVVSAGIRSWPDGNSEQVAEDGRQVFQVLGQILLPEGTDGIQVEAAEWAMFDEVIATIQRNDLPDSLHALYPGRMTQSQQLEAPHGWMGIELENFVIEN